MMKKDVERTKSPKMLDVKRAPKKFFPYVNFRGFSARFARKSIKARETTSNHGVLGTEPLLAYEAPSLPPQSPPPHVLWCHWMRFSCLMPQVQGSGWRRAKRTPLAPDDLLVVSMARVLPYPYTFVLRWIRACRGVFGVVAGPKPTHWHQMHRSIDIIDEKMVQNFVRYHSLREAQQVACCIPYEYVEMDMHQFDVLWTFSARVKVFFHL
jgi:hypothetical protein